MDSEPRKSSMSSNGKDRSVVSIVNPAFEVEEASDEDFTTLPGNSSPSSLELESGGGNGRGGNFSSKGSLERQLTSFHPRKAKSVVTVRNAVKGFGSGDPILNNFNMTVQKGTIYSLLGSSGCGKTTLLSCVVGVKNLNSGEILVFGAKPGTEESGVPGRRVGYMPQDTALYSEFSIAECIRYFGTLYGMPTEDIETTKDFLIDFLDLPDETRRIAHLSGGQKRRVSLAVSLVHSPELLILDEPTVGVDPLLRESIWNHLVKLVTTHQTTVIITTHYIAEASDSHMIGLMRGGRLLAEKSPAALLEEYQTHLLEDIVLKLCKKDGFGAEGDSTYQEAQDLPQVVVRSNELKNEYCEHRRMSIVGEARVFTNSSSINRIKALVKKNLLMMIRNLILLIFMLFIPAFQIFVLCIGVGTAPKPMDFGFVNHEVNFSGCQSVMSAQGSCNIENLGCQFMNHLSHEYLPLHDYNSEELARKGVEDGKIWGYMTFPPEFSEHLYSKATSEDTNHDNTTIQGSQIIIDMDLSNIQIAFAIKRLLVDSYKQFLDELLDNCGYPRATDVPIKFAKPIYGKEDTDFTEYSSPSLLLAMMYFFPMCSSGVSYIKDKKQGTLERTMVSGVKTWEIMTAFFLSESFILIIQSGLNFTVIMAVFGIKIQGSLFLAVLLSVMMGLTGVSLGFSIASFCKEEIEVAMLAMGSFFPNFAFAGLIWPIEGMPRIMQYIGYLLPLTLAGESIRSIVSRGQGLFHPNVWPGFGSTVMWFCLYWILTVFIVKKLAKGQ